MKRSFLKELGLEADVIDKILDEYGKDINRERGKVEKLESQLEDLNTKFNGVDVEKLKNDAESWKTKFEGLETKIATEKAEKEFNEFLKTHFDEFKVRDEVSVKAHLDFDKIKQSKDQTKEIKEQLANVQKEKSYLFDAVEGTPNDNTFEYVPAGGNSGDLTAEQQLAQELANAINGTF